MNKLEKRKNILKEAGVLLVATILVLTAIVMVPMTMAQQPGHDVGVSEIISPFSGCLRTYPVKVKVTNYESNAETFDVQVNIFKCESEVILIDEDFSGTFPPDGWTTDYWKKSDTTNEAGGVSPEARMYYYDQRYPYYDYYDNYIMSKTVDTSTCDKIKLEFNFKADIREPNYECYFHVKWTNDGGATWNEITPWTNPITSDFGPERFKITISDCGLSCCGNDFQVKWEYIGYYGYYNYFYLDDVKIVKTCVDGEYAELVGDVTIPASGEVFVNFPDWTPSDYGEYCVTAFTLLENDDDQSNDCKTVNIIVTDDPEELIDDLLTYFETFQPPRLPPGKYNPPHNYLKQAKDKITSGMTGDPCHPDNQAHLDIAKDRLNYFITYVDALLGDGLISYDEWYELTTAAQSIIYFLTYCIPC